MVSEFFIIGNGKMSKVNKPGNLILNKFHKNSMEIIMFNVGECEAIIVKNNKKSFLIDGGAGRKTENEKLGKDLSRYIDDNEIKLNGIVASHNHLDHLNALSSVLKECNSTVLASRSKYYHNGGKLGQKLTKTLGKRLTELIKNKKNRN